MSPAKGEVLAVATVTPQFKMHFPKGVADAMNLLGGGIIGFYSRSDVEVIIRKLPGRESVNLKQRMASLFHRALFSWRSQCRSSKRR